MAGRKRRRKGPALDLEAMGLILGAGGAYVAVTVYAPGLQVGTVGEEARRWLLAVFGWGAWIVPLPLLIFGILMFLRRPPTRALARAAAVAGALGAALALSWFYSLVSGGPALGGELGRALASGLHQPLGLAGAFPYLVLLVFGLEVVLGLRTGSVLRWLAAAVLAGLRATRWAVGGAGQRAKEAAARNEIRQFAARVLEPQLRDLATLLKLYPDDPQLLAWRAEAAQAGEIIGGREGLALRADPASDEVAGTIDRIRQAAKARSEALAAFVGQRAEALVEGVAGQAPGDLEEWTKTALASLREVVEADVAAARALESVRRSLISEVAALQERVRRATRERDQDLLALRNSPSATDLAAIAGRAQTRQGHLEADQRRREELEIQATHLSAWRDLVDELALLRIPYPEAEGLKSFDVEAAGLCRRDGLAALPEVYALQSRLETIRRELGPVIDRESAGEATVGADEPGAAGPQPGPAASAQPAEPAPAEAGAEPGGQVREQPRLLDPPPVRRRGLGARLPDLSLLDPEPRDGLDGRAQLAEAADRARLIDEALRSFSLQAKVVAYARGPQATRFEVEPAPGEKISRIANLANDLALALAVGSVRIEAPITGKSVIGLEVPNADRDLVTFRAAAQAPAYARAKARLPLIIGKSIDGEWLVGDLARMPHLLIAGSTGAGKSVCVNALVTSLVYKYLPSELRLLLVDPKMVELTPYDGIPHLVKPVVTSAMEAAGILQGAVGHMERRYRMMSLIGAKNLDQFNQKAPAHGLAPLPHLIVVIDELADLMVTSPKETEASIMRLAQMARATGMHLILATQRPSVDILTSLIKVNVPARIAFAVASGYDSRTILDVVGAERLTGQGDMLYYQPGFPKPVRLQGPLISEAEIGRITAFLRAQPFEDEFGAEFGWDFEPPEGGTAGMVHGLVDFNEPLLRQAAILVVEEGSASVSRLQRRLSVGHARAGKIIDSLEGLGIVGPHQGSKTREVLVGRDELVKVFGSLGEEPILRATVRDRAREPAGE